MNLNYANPSELEVYRAAVAKVLDIDPLMLDFIDMPDPFGRGTNKVLYAKRGAAEILRKNMGINVHSLEQTSQDGWVSFKATGTNAAGRQEIAVGAAYTQGVTGEKVAHAIMTAQTRAVRRLTLQFVTGGILDESEVQTQLQFSNTPGASQAALEGSPMVVPPPVLQLKTEYHVPATLPAAITIPQHVGEIVKIVPPIVSEAAPKADIDLTIHNVTPLESEAIQAAASGILSGTIVPTNEPFAEPVKKKRTRRTKAEVAAPVQTEIPAGYIQADGKIVPDPTGQAEFEAKQAKLRAEAAASLSKVSTPVAPPVQAVAAPVVEKEQPKPAQPQAAPLLTPEVAAEFKRLNREWSSVLSDQGGMLPTDGIGGTTMKLRLFAQKHAGATDASLTQAQGEAFFKFLTDFKNQFGPQALVAYINTQIGVK